MKQILARSSHDDEASFSPCSNGVLVDLNPGTTLQAKLELIVQHDSYQDNISSENVYNEVLSLSDVTWTPSLDREDINYEDNEYLHVIGMTYL